MSDAAAEPGIAGVVNAFLRRFPDSQRVAYRRLLYYAAMPLVLTPELLHYLRSTFVRDAPWVAEVDLLLDIELCQEKNFEQYTMPIDVRAALLNEARSKLGEVEIQEAAKLLVRYIYHHLPRAALSQREWTAQAWAALLYLDDYHDQVVGQIVRDMQDALAASRTGDSHSGQAVLESMVEYISLIAPELHDCADLVEFARLTQRILHDELDSLAFTPEMLEEHRSVAGVEMPSLAQIVRIKQPTRPVPPRKPRLQVVTRGGHQVVLDDNNGTIVLETAGGHRVTVNQQDGSLSITSQGAIRLKAGTNINVSAGNIISITAGSQVNVTGSLIKLNDP